MPDYDLIAILGPTASGKTPFAAALAYELNTEITVSYTHLMEKQKSDINFLASMEAIPAT